MDWNLAEWQRRVAEIDCRLYSQKWEVVWPTWRELNKPLPEIPPLP